MMKYRMLREGEIRRDDDELNRGKSEKPRWGKTVLGGFKMPKEHVGLYRRPLKSKPRRKGK
jgi:hypothetical protein